MQAGMAPRPCGIRGRIASAGHFAYNRGMYLRMLSFVGLLVFLGIAWVASERRRAFPWRTVLSGVGLQLALGVFVLRTPVGRALFEYIKRGFMTVVDSSKAGADFVFGPLVPKQGTVLAITIMCTIIVVSTLMALLYHWGVMQRVVHAIAWVMCRVMRVSGRESLVAAANIFMGMTEAPLFIRPYLNVLTRSEMLALMVSGMATMAGGVLAVYVSWGVSAVHLLTASVMSAPAALVIAKIMVPPLEQPAEDDEALNNPALHTHAVNAFEAITNGARDGLYLSLNVLAMLIAVISLLWLVNRGLGACGGLIGLPELSLQGILGWICRPIAIVMGVPLPDTKLVGELLGKQIFLTEFIAYRSLADNVAVLSPRAVTITTYALCGFANVGSVAIELGALTTLAPDRKKDIVELAWRALLGGALASYCTAAIAGMLL